MGTDQGLKSLVTKIPLQDDHLALQTSPLTKSCTKNIFAAKVPAEMYKPGTKKNQMNMYICDSPGFGDSGGV
jgi:hypothetical protein